MRKSFITLLLLILALSSLGWTESWESIRSNSGRITSIQADFTQEKHLPILTRPIISSGLFIFQSPSSLRWQYKSPVQSLLLMHGRSVQKFIQRDTRLVEEHTMGMDSMQMVLQEISHWLDGRFTDNPAFAAELKADGTIVMTPREKGLARLISRIVLTLADQPGLMKSVVIYEGEDSFTRLTFSNALLNQPIAPAVFTKQ